jgi:hypothetical protein
MLREKSKSLVAGGLAAALIALGPAIAIAKTDNGSDNPGNKVTICHATGSQTNPYVQISPNANGVISGHVNHQDTRDIIPPFSYNHGTTKSFPGQNFDASGQAVLRNGCKVTIGQGGGGGGGGTTNTGGQTQVLGSTSGGAQVSAVPQGSVNGGGGGANDFSLTTLNRAR